MYTKSCVIAEKTFIAGLLTFHLLTQLKVTVANKVPNRVPTQYKPIYAQLSTHDHLFKSTNVNIPLKSSNNYYVYYVCLFLLLTRMVCRTEDIKQASKGISFNQFG